MSEIREIAGIDRALNEISFGGALQWPARRRYPIMMMRLSDVLFRLCIALAKEKMTVTIETRRDRRWVIEKTFIIKRKFDARIPYECSLSAADGNSYSIQGPPPPLPIRCNF